MQIMFRYELLLSRVTKKWLVMGLFSSQLCHGSNIERPTPQVPFEFGAHCLHQTLGKVQQTKRKNVLLNN